MTTKTINTETAEAIRELAQVRSIIKELEEQERKLRNAVVEALGDHKEAIFRGQKVASLTFVTRTTVDSKALAEKFPEAFEATRKESTSPRLTLA